MGGASRFIMILTNPSPFHCLLHPCPSLLRLVRNLSITPHRLTHSPIARTHHPPLLFIKSSQQQLHTQPNSLKPDSFTVSSDSRPSHPWPELSNLIDTVSKNGYFDMQRFAATDVHGIQSEDAFVAYEDLTEEFVRASSACLAFARDRSDLLGSVSSRVMEVIVQNGTPFLFKSALDTARRMRAFLGIGGSIVLESDKAQMVDLMKYLLSYASNPTVSSDSNNLYSTAPVESYVRKLLNDLAGTSSTVSASDLSASQQYQFPGRYGYGQTSMPFGQNIEMKRGDWICPKCSFMNFARNIKCLECEEPRPKRQLTGGEWECPQCDFFNYGRNVVCLRCDCKRPGEASLGTANSRAGLGYNGGDSAKKADVDSRLAANEEKAQRWFSNVSELNNASDLSTAAADEDFPEIMPLRKGVNRFVVSTRKRPLERRLANSQYRDNSGNDGTVEAIGFQTGNGSKTLDPSISQSLDQILGHTSSVSGADDKSITTGQHNGAESSSPLPSSASHPYGLPKGSNSNYVPFVPLPPDMFAKKPPSSKMEDDEKVMAEGEDSASSMTTDQTVPVSVTGGSQDKEREQAEKSERWFKRVAELHDVKDLTSEISDEDFPEIMPTRKGENRFVVSKKKDRSLTSPMYKRHMAMEQARNTNYVPFVPFPSDYFTKKDKQQPDCTEKSSEISTCTTLVKCPEKSDDARRGVNDMNQVQKTNYQQNHTGTGNSQSWDYGAPVRGNPTQNSFASQTIVSDGRSGGYSGKENISQTTNDSPPENQNVRSGWTGNSLEGSAVKEPDPLDMSEEAKAERWFRRVAQIKDISELSQIPDEDFPSIMPMRKGVNRFVVSKRKTPLERRLTSPQYRRNLPVVTSDPVKKENDRS